MVRMPPCRSVDGVVVNPLLRAVMQCHEVLAEGVGCAGYLPVLRSLPAVTNLLSCPFLSKYLPVTEALPVEKVVQAGKQISSPQKICDKIISQP